MRNTMNESRPGRFMLALVAILAMTALCACHGGGGTTSDEGGDGGSGGTPSGADTEFGALANARDGFILQFSEAMDTASVEANLHILQGDFSATADISKAVRDGEEVVVKSFIWLPDHKSVRVIWPARYGHSYTIILDTGAMTEAGVPLDARIVSLAEVGPNPLNYDGDAEETAEMVTLNGFVTDDLGDQLPTFMVFSPQETMSLMANGLPINLGKLKLSEYWYYSDPNLSAAFASIKKLGHMDDNDAILGNLVRDNDSGNLLYLFSHDVNGVPVMKIGTDLAGKGKVNNFWPIGDLNADGYQDMLIQVYPDEETLLSALVLGRPSFSADLGAAPATDEKLYAVADVNPIPAVKTACYGDDYQGHPTGDFDGDGFGDFAFCQKDGAANPLQIVHIYHGAAAGSLSAELSGDSTISNMTTSTGLQIMGVAAADLNGDLIEDLIVPYIQQATPPATKAAPATYGYIGLLVFFGEKGDRTDKFVPADADVDIKLGYGKSVSPVNMGDLDADGFDDIAVRLGAYIDPDTLEPSVGDFSIIKGQAEWPAVVDAEKSSVYCADVMDMTCGQLMAMGDVDNDGYNDMGLTATDLFANYYYLYVFGGGPQAGDNEITENTTGGFSIITEFLYY